MKPHHRKIATSAAVALGALGAIALGAFAYISTGFYNIGADDPHFPMTYSALDRLRIASIRHHSSTLKPPADLMSEARIKQGAGNYSAMCTQCHLAPGMPETELSKGLYPKPPNLSKETVEASAAFWTIKHGIKASGMPAWGGSMGDDYIWNMAAFLQQLPKLDKAGYDALVATSGGHSHGGGETGESAPHGHAAGQEHDAAPMDPNMPMPAGGQADAPGTPPHDDAPAATGHPHAPGTPPHDDAPAPAASRAHAAGTPAHDDAPAPAHAHAPGTPPHDDAPKHVDAPGTPPHKH